MSNIAEFRVEVNPKEEDRSLAFKKMFENFKRTCKHADILRHYKQHETYESKSRKKRRKQRESESARLKTKLKENFMQGKLNEKS